MDSDEQAVLRTILYADIFDASIHSARVKNLLISGSHVPPHAVDKALIKLQKKQIITKKSEVISLAGRSTRSNEKKIDASINSQKKKIAQKASDLLSTIQTIQFIGLSGALASDCVTPGDDIDFFIITKKSTLWSTRLYALLLFEQQGLRRSRGDVIGKDKICLNMFISDDAMAFPQKRHEIYTAMEIAQMVPLFSRKKTYEMFIEKNAWIQNYLANFIPQKPLRVSDESNRSILGQFPMIQLAKLIQLPVMMLHRTSETITDQLFAFHPRDYREFVLTEFMKRRKEYNV